MASFRLNSVVYLAKQQGLLGRALLCRYSSGTKATKKPAGAADQVKSSPKPATPPKPTDKVVTKPASTPQASTSVYKVEEYYTFTEYSYYDLDPNVTKLRCPVPDKFK